MGANPGGTCASTKGNAVASSRHGMTTSHAAPVGEQSLCMLRP